MTKRPRVSTRKRRRARVATSAAPRRRLVENRTPEALRRVLAASEQA
jgi:hypothetical protein